MRTYNVALIPAGTVMNADLASSAAQLLDMSGYSIQVVFTGTPTGTFKLQASSDPYSKGTLSPAPAPSHWTDVASSSVAVSAAGNYMWNVTDVFYDYVRVIYTDGSSGASTAVITSCIFNGKGM